MMSGKCAHTCLILSFIIINNPIQVMDQHPNFPCPNFYDPTIDAPPACLCYDCHDQHMQTLEAEHAKELVVRKILKQRIKQLQQDNLRLRLQNGELQNRRLRSFQLRKQQDSPYDIKKRYRKGSKQKKYRLCDAEGCSKKFSSLIALRLHRRSHHGC